MFYGSYLLRYQHTELDLVQPEATKPAICAISTINLASTSSAISRKRLKSIVREYALAPATISFGRCSLLKFARHRNRLLLLKDPLHN